MDRMPLKAVVAELNKYSDELVIKALNTDLRMCYLIDKEAKKRMREWNERDQEAFCDNNIFAILACCRRVFGCGKKKMERFMLQYEFLIQDLKKEYSCDKTVDVMPVCKMIVEESGFDLEEFKKRRKVVYKVD